MSRRFLHIQPTELRFPFQPNKLCTCCLQLTNKTEHNVAFKVKTTHPKKYCVRPRVGVVLPGLTCFIEVMMQAQKESPGTMLPKDKFLIQSMVLPVGVDTQNVTSEMFRKDDGKAMQEYKMRVVLVTANPPSPIPEGSEEDSSSEASEVETAEHPNCRRALFHASETAVDSEDEPLVVSAVARVSGDVYSEDCTVSKLIEERYLAVAENRRLHHAVEMLKSEMRRNCSNGMSMKAVLLIILLGFLVGYVIRTVHDGRAQSV